MAGVTGFLSGNGGNNNGPTNNGTPSPYVGLNYYFGDTSALLVSGAAAFGRDMPITEAAAIAFAYSDGIPAHDFNQAVVGKANAQLVAGDAITPSNTPTGLSLSNIWIDQNNNSGTSPNFNRDLQPNASKVVEQGTLSGGLGSGTGISVGGILGWERWTGTITTCTAQPCDNPNSRTFTLTDDQGLHIVHGVPATNLPTSLKYDYALAGATNPTVANGSFGPGTLIGPNTPGASNPHNLSPSTMSVQFGTNNPGVTANLNVTMTSPSPTNLPESYSIQGTMPLNNVRFNSSTLSVATTGTPTLCTGTCTGSVGGFLAGPGAVGLGVFYQISGSTPTAANTVISGAAGFKRGTVGY
jgi:hypothetical protein